MTLSMVQAAPALPKALKPYISHKRVLAARIETFTASTITLEGGETIGIDPNIFNREVPTPGWWFILYADGYQSLSPPQAFEEGYKPEGEATPTVDLPVALLLDSAIAKIQQEQPGPEVKVALVNVQTALLWLNSRKPRKDKEH